MVIIIWREIVASQTTLDVAHLTRVGRRQHRIPKISVVVIITRGRGGDGCCVRRRPILKSKNIGGEIVVCVSDDDVFERCDHDGEFLLFGEATPRRRRRRVVGGGNGAESRSL